jgi:hypothetical protein
MTPPIASPVMPTSWPIPPAVMQALMRSGYESLRRSRLITGDLSGHAGQHG